MFANSTETEWKDAQSAWGIECVRLEKDAYLIHEGDVADCIFWVRSGSLLVVVDDYWGLRSVLNTVGSDGLFGAAYAFSDSKTYPLSVVAAEDSVVCRISVERLLASKETNPTLYVNMMYGLLRAISNRSVALIHTIEQIKQPTLRDKIIAYLTYQSRQAKSNEFRIPLTRQQLADYLAVDRAALSREISRMQAEGLLWTKGREFRLL